MEIAPQDIKKLTKAEKLKLLSYLEERARRDKEKKDNYKPNSMQKEVHASEKKIRLVVSGNGAGKTTMACHEAWWSASGFNPISKQFIPVPRRVVVVLDKPDKVADKWLPELRKWFDLKEDRLSKQGKPYYTKVDFDNGSELKFMFHDQDLLTFESLECDDLIFDEPPPRKVYVALIRGMRNRGMKARILIIGTPITGSWLRKEIYEPWARGELTDTDCFKFNTDVNKDNLPDGYISWFSSKLSEKERKIRIEGEFFDLQGQALAHLFRRESHIIQRGDFIWDDNNPCVVSIDPHPEKNHVACILGADKQNRIYYISELSIKELPRQFARRLLEWYRPYRVVDIVCDSLGSSAYTGGEGFKSFIEVLREEGVLVRATTYDDKQDDVFITRIQDALFIPTEADNFGQKIPKLRILQQNHGIISDIENVMWAIDKRLEMNKPKLEITNRDFLATLKYALAANPHYKKGETKVYKRDLPETYGFKKKKKDSFFDF